MGGSYTDYNTTRYSRSYDPEWKTILKSFKKTKDRFELISAYKAHAKKNAKGFIKEIAEVAGIAKIEDIAKEFPEIEYEVKFDITVHGNDKEPSIESFLDAFDFSIGPSGRYLKDSVNNIAVGTNHFFGDDLDERLVVIEKAGNTYLKEKGRVIKTDVGVPYENIVIKRTESRYQAGLDTIIGKINTVSSKDVDYRGSIRKEKGDAFIIDTTDGRIYSFTVTRAHLKKPGFKEETDIQRQLEIEYAGYIPIFDNFEKENEKQLVQGIVDVAKFIYVNYGKSTPVAKGWTLDLEPTNERKYDFVIGKKKELKGSTHKSLMPYSSILESMPVRKERVLAKN